jgi:MFS family permease
MPDNTLDEAPRQSLVLVLTVLGGINLVNYMDRVLFSLMVEPVKAELELSDGQMGLLGGFAFALVYALLGLVAGRIADSRNRVSLIGVALSVWSLATALCGLVNSFVQMFASRMLVGAGEAGCVPAAQSIIADVAPAKNRAFMISMFTGIGTVGTLIGLILGGVLIELIGWRMTFVAFGLFGFFPLIILFLTLKDPRSSLEATGTSSVSWRQDVSEMLKRREIQILLIGIPLVYTLAGMGTWIPAFFQRTHDITTEQFSSVGGAYLGIGLILGTFAGGFIANRLVARDFRWEFWWSALSCALAMAPLLLVLLSSNLTIAYLGLFGAFFIAGTSFGPSMACMHTVSKKSVRATAVASMVFTSSLIAYGGVPVLIGYLSDLFASSGASVADGASLRNALLVTMVLPPIASLLFLVASRSAFADGKLQELSSKA